MLGRLRTPLAQVALLYILVLGLSIAGREPGGLAAMGAMSVFAVINPLTVAMGHAWWRQTVLSAVLFGALFAVLGATPAIAAMREGAMVFLLPALLFALTVPIGGLIRLWRWSRVRAAS